MKATEAKLLEFLKKSPQFVIPIYQRTYSWKEKECLQLWDDIMRSGLNENIKAHFLGSVVYVEKGLYSVSSQTPLLVIDGQQRLTTITLLIAALTEVIGDQEPLEDFSYTKLKGYYLTNPLENGEKFYKLVLSQTDDKSLKAIIKGLDQPDDRSIRVVENFEFFKSKLQKLGDLKPICSGLAKLMVVDISLNREQDNPQLIFESMNSTGKELSQADLIRNYILMGLEPDLQSLLYEQYWRPMELAFGQQAYSDYFDSFMRHFLTVKTREIPKIGDVYEVFKDYSRRPAVASKGVDELVKDIRNYAVYFCAFALGKEKDDQLKLAFKDLRELKVDVAFPLLLELYSDFASELLSHSEFLSAIRIIESYVFRRAICEIPTNSMNKTFARMGLGLKKDRYLESVKASFLLLPSYRRFPSDEEFHRKIQTKDIYNFRSKSYWLRRMENFGRKERILVNEYTIEHIMPQADNKAEKLPQVWRSELGEEWERVWETYRHTLGNLTLTGYNSEYSNNAFPAKCDHEYGFKFSPLKMNEGIAAETRWDEAAIQKRANKLADKATDVWAKLELPKDIIDAYKPQLEQSNEYSLADHPNLATGKIADIYQVFRKAVLELDPCVVEDVKKLYVAFKAETNFVDVVPQAKRLRLSLNMPFAEINDPRGLCKDVTNLGRWGNGDVEVGLDNLDDIHHVMALVTQVFERQMGTDDI
ncbi:GmrSD restriction endonuclease domain-containing protein [Shewanella frigidimarina]|uniref:GmrSD restriction endonuclease domain-containing protein n=1 Tax=Shewanella frigidimarina TaxID=56812 RepID=UPI003D7BE7B3